MIREEYTLPVHQRRNGQEEERLLAIGVESDQH
jgi:hypothetical protein